MNIYLPLLANTPSGAGAFIASPLFLMIIMFLIMYFLIIRPQKKQKQELQKKINALQKGDKIITIGGIHGIVHNIGKTSITLKIGESNLIELEKASVHQIVNKNS